jgi:hypothetical protein
VPARIARRAQKDRIVPCSPPPAEPGQRLREQSSTWKAATEWLQCVSFLCQSASGAPLSLEGRGIPCHDGASRGCCRDRNGHGTRAPTLCVKKRAASRLAWLRRQEASQTQAATRAKRLS